MTSMNITPLHPFGAEVTGLDLADVSALQFDQLAHLVATARVVVFRQQAIDDAAFVRFLVNSNTDHTTSAPCLPNPASRST